MTEEDCFNGGEVLVKAGGEGRESAARVRRPIFHVKV